MQNVIVLNGPSSAGKTSIAKVLQAKLETPYLHVLVDAFWGMVPKHIPDDSVHFPNMKYAFIDAAKAVVDHGHNIILDAVFAPATMRLFCEKLNTHEIFSVAVTADVEILRSREVARGDRKPGLTESQHKLIPGDFNYDLLIDTTHTKAEEAAARILTAFAPQ